MADRMDTFATAVELLAAMDTGELTSTELLEAFLAQIEDHSWVNAVVTVDVDRARAEARLADAVRASGRRFGPLHGLPITVKHDVKVAGMPSTYGSATLRDYVPDEDAEAVARLRRAGAIVFGRTNLPEFAKDGQSYNTLHGTTANPWNGDLTPGGSSGGSAAALAAGMTGLELGSDMGGSIRIPASWCGVTGLKPTWGIVPVSGGVPSPDDPPGAELVVPDIAAAGPMARGAADLDLALTVLSGRGGPALAPPRFSAHRQLRAVVWLDDDVLPTASTTLTVLEDACRALEADGACIDYKKRPNVTLSESEELFEILFMADVTGGIGAGDFEALRRQLAAQRSADPMLAWHHRALELTHREWLELQRRRLRIMAAWEEFFTDVDVLLTPTVFTTALAHDHSEPVWERTYLVDGKARSWRPNLTRWCAMPGVSLLPATTVPVGRTSQGLPVGMQVIAGRYADRSTIRAAMLIEQTLGGFARPPMNPSTQRPAG
ncbi:amidase family protein [Nonomuraea sp. 3N208]|uniref:amidase family protein n=1 Tax=Nonomuraea sp. 3N208 TaxID=3457421 RepID=UPI003FD456DE